MLMKKSTLWKKILILLVSIPTSYSLQLLLQSAKANAQQAGGYQTVCGIGAPRGFVAVRYGFSLSCPETFRLEPNSTVITKPRDGLTICGLSTPAGFLRVRSLYSSSCDVRRSPSRRDNATLISDPGPLTAVRVGRGIRVGNCSRSVFGRARRSATVNQPAGEWSQWIRLINLPDWRVFGTTCEWIPAPPGQLGVADLEWNDPPSRRTVGLYQQQL